MKSPKSFTFSLPKVILTLIILVKLSPLHSQTAGCKDPMANNYNPLATVNDGKCEYDPFFYEPPIKVDPLNSVLFETSGLQMAGGFLWTFNDSDSIAVLYRIDTLSKTILQTVTLAGAAHVDWEDIAFDGTNFYVGDFGNNANGGRKDLRIYKFPLSAIPADYNAIDSVTIPANLVGIINFTYSDQGEPVKTTSNNTKFDCEAMIVDSGQIHLFTKNWIDANTVHYLINGSIAGTYVAMPIDTLKTNYLVTAAAKAPDQDIVVLLGYQRGLPGNHYMHILSDYSGGKYFNGNKRRIDLPDASVMGQAEGITFRNNTYGYISNERLFIINQRLRSFDIGNFTPLYVLPLTLTKFTVNKVSNLNQIAWSFDDAVQNLNIEYSTDGVAFIILKTFESAVSNIYNHKPVSRFNYYRISWKKNNGSIQYSKIISVKNELNQAISNFSLRANGELTFLLGGSLPGKYSFRLLSSDGKSLSQLKERLYVTGNNKIQMPGKTIMNNFVYLVVHSTEQETTTCLPVKK